MRKLLLAVAFACGCVFSLGQNIGDHRTAGFTNSRTYLNSDLDNFNPPLKLSRTLGLVDLENGDSLIAFDDFLLVGQGKTLAKHKYHLINRTTGALAWTHEFTGFPIGPQVVLDLDYVPAYANDIVILGGQSTTAKAVRVSSGAQLWADTSVGDSRFRFPILTDNAAIIHGSGGLIAVNATTGAVLWRFTIGTAKAPLSMFGRRLFMLQDNGTLHALDLDFKSQPPPGAGIPVWSAVGAGSDFSQMIATEKYVFINRDDGSFRAINAQTGGVIWTKSIAGTFARPPLALAYDRLYVFSVEAGQFTTRALNPDSGDLLWEVREPASSTAGVTPPPLSGAAIANNLIYYYEHVNGRIQARDAFTGVLLWSIGATDVQSLSLADDSLIVLFSNKIQIYKPSEDIFFAHLADGIFGTRKQTTLIALTNVTSETAKGELTFVDPTDPTGGAPLALAVEGKGTVSTISFTIPPNSSVQFQTLGQGSLRRGWALVESDKMIRGSSIFQLSEGGTIFLEAGVGDSPPSGRANVFVVRKDGFSTAIAIANPFAICQTRGGAIPLCIAPQKLPISLRLLNAGGAEVGRTEFVLTSSQEAKFIEELFGTAVVVDGFEGTLVIESPIPVVVTALRTQQGLQMSSYPVGQVVR